MHLEGSLTPDLSLELARKNDVDIGVRAREDVAALYDFVDFEHFLRLYGELTFLLAEPEDFRTAVLSYAQHMTDVGAIYAELTLTLGTHVHFKGLDPDAVMRAAWAGAQQAEADYGVVIRFILDHVRSFSLERCYETVNWCQQYRRYGVVGLGLAGPEAGWPCSTYRPALELAADLGIPFVPHAGEADGPDAIWNTLEFQPRRIGHAVTAIEDPDLLRTLHERDTMVEICASSNVLLGHVVDLEHHPARRYWEMGIAISINTDDPPMFATDLLREHELLYTKLRFTIAELTAINRQALYHTLVDDGTIRRLDKQF